MEELDILRCPVCKTRHVQREGQRVNGIYAADCENCDYFFKYRAVPPYKTSVSFTVNGLGYTAGNEFEPSTSLADFLREKRVSMGTKIMCKQGGCGICVVEAKMQLDPAQPKVAANLNACLCPLFLCDGWDITTIEGIGNTRTGMHLTQANLADFMGSQCGYCSPGQIMNMYGLIQKYPQLNKQSVEDHFEGNLCRCTGYRPILDAFKAMVPSSSTDIEDLTAKMCINDPGKKCESASLCSGNCRSNNTAVKPIRMVFGNIQWFKAADYSELLALLQQYSGKKIRLMGSNTGTGAFWSTENIGNFEVVIDISGITDFYTNNYDVSTKTFTLGANVTLSDIVDLFEREEANSSNKASFDELKKYLYRVASSPIRNRATWAGNLMLKNHISSFPSDVFNIMTVLNASLFIGPSPQDFISSDTFLTTNMAGKALRKVTFGDIPANDVIVCFKVMPRSQNSLALVNAAFRCTVNQPNFTVMGQPVISIGGISGMFHRASKTETYLIGKQLSSPTTLAGALGILSTELVPSNDTTLPSSAYRKIVACALLYKYFLRVLGTTAGARYRSGSTVLHDIRPLSSGTQSYDTKKVEWPLNEPLKKIEANIQCTGEAEYVDDIPPLPNQLYAAFVKSTQANATIQAIDTSAIVGMAGVIKVLTAADIPVGGKNDIFPGINNPGHEAEEVLCSGHVHYFGQAVALVVAETQKIADQAASLVKVTYRNIQIPIITIDDAIQKQSIVPTPGIKDVVVGNPDQAIAMAQYVTSGAFYQESQYHFHMETQCTIAIPTADGLKVKTTTQWTDCIQQVVSQICAIPKSRVTVEVDRLGGGFGGKISRNAIPAGACGLAAYITNRPVRMRMALWDNMDMIGKRNSYKANYEVGHDGDGKIKGIIVTYYGDVGCYGNELQRLRYLLTYIDNAYFCQNWKAKVIGVRTNKPASAACRSPGSLPAIFFMEQMMEHVSRTLSKDPLAVKTLNLYKTGQVTPLGMTLTQCNLTPVLSQLLSSAQVTSRQQDITTFNTDNRWKKRALSVVPMKWGVEVDWTTYSVLVNIHGGDGSVLVQHGGVEMGQGINTKVAQVCAFELDIPVAMVTVKGTNSVIDVNNSATGGSVTSEVCCQAVIICCANIKARMTPVKVKMVNPTWVDLVNKCLGERISLSEKVVNSPTYPPPFEYNTFGATCTEVELDVLTGEYQINRVDIVYDCGESLNPAVDIGQVEGGFIMGLGYSTSEELKFDPTTGRLLTDDTWSYHPPTNKDIPIDFRISLLKNVPNPSGVLRSKLSGEPPLCMSCSVFYALRKCIEEARKEAGNTTYFDFCPPATVEKVQQACLVDTSQFLLQ